MYNCYTKNAPYGSICRPVNFYKKEVKKVKGKDVLVIYSTEPFFDELRCHCEYCHTFYGKFDFCLEWNLDLPVVLSDDNGKTVIPLETKINGYTIWSNMIAPFCGTCTPPVMMMCCYDLGNDHITIAKYFPKHKPCCDESIESNDDSRMVLDEEVTPQSVVEPMIQSASAKVTK